MHLIPDIVQRAEAGHLDDTLRRLYCIAPEQSVAGARRRVTAVAEGFAAHFAPPPERAVALCSAPGRTEIGGNHTDHQRGRVLAAAINLDMLACAAPNGGHPVRIHSEGWPALELDSRDLQRRAEEAGTNHAILRGVLARVRQLGYAPGGFDAYITSDVLPGSGLSSSAAYEVLLGVVVNHLFCRDELDAVALAQIGQYAENVYFDKPSGLMDQMACALGGGAHLDFRDAQSPVVRRVELDLGAYGYGLCIIDSGAHHGDLTAQYATIPAEMGRVAAFFGKEVLREVEPDAFFTQLKQLRAAVGDRAALRGLHFMGEDARAAQEADALAAGDFDRFLRLVNTSGLSSLRYLQNIDPAGEAANQPMLFALALAERALDGRGAVRVHGGGFAGTVQAFVPLEGMEEFCRSVEAVLGSGACHVLAVRPDGGTVLDV